MARCQTGATRCQLRGAKKSFEWKLVENEPHAVHTAKRPEPESTREQILTGVLVGESKTSVDIANGEGKIQSVLRMHIDELTASTKSLMPDGFE